MNVTIALLLAAVQAVPAAPCTPGIHVVAADGTLTALPLVKATHRKATGMMGMMLLGPAGGNRLKIKTVVPGAGAATLLREPRPTFRICFSASTAPAAASGDYVGTTARVSPRDYQLVRFELIKDQRQLTLSAAGGFGGPQGQISESTVPFTTEEVSPGQYRVTLSRALEPGQYGFVSAVSAPSSTRKKDVTEQFYDFAVTG